jgi:hypothetical protein
VGVLDSGILVIAAGWVGLGGLSVGVTAVVDVTATISLAFGLDDGDILVVVGISVGCARLIGWQEDKKIISTQEMIAFLSTFGVYHKIYP